MILIPEILLNNWHSKLQWQFNEDRGTIEAIDRDDSITTIYSIVSSLANKIIVRRHNENLLLGISDEEYNETAKAAPIPKPSSVYHKLPSHKRMGVKTKSNIHKRY